MNPHTLLRSMYQPRLPPGAHSMKYTYVYKLTCTHIQIYVYIYIYRENVFGRPMLLLIRMRSVCIHLNTNVIRGLVKRAQLHNFWENVHNCWEMCTTAGKRAQHLWHVHNISEPCTTSLNRAHIEYLKTLGGGGETRYTHIYTYIYICVCVCVYTHPNLLFI